MGTSDSKPSAAVSTDAKTIQDAMDAQLMAQLASLEAELAVSQGMQSTVQQQKLLLLEADLRMNKQLADLDEAKDEEEGEGAVIDQGDEEVVVIEDHELAELEAELEALEMKEEENKAGNGDEAS